MKLAMDAGPSERLTVLKKLLRAMVLMCQGFPGLLNAASSVLIRVGGGIMWVGEAGVKASSKRLQLILIRRCCHLADSWLG